MKSLSTRPGRVAAGVRAMLSSELRSAALFAWFVSPLLSMALPYTASASETETAAEADGDRLSNIVVTGHKGEKYLGDAKIETAPVSQATLTSEQLQEFVGLGTAVSGALNYLPSVHFSGGDSTGISEGTFTVRGFRYDEFGIIRDGVPLNDPLYQTPHNDFAGDPENYESVSLIRGSSDIGAATLTSSGGSVIIKTVDPTESMGLLFKQGFGTDGLFRTYGRFNTGKYDGFSAWISASHAHGDLWTRAPGDENATRYEANVQYQWAPESKVNLIASSFEMNTNGTFKPTLAQYQSLPYYSTFQGPAITPGSSLALMQRADFKIQTFALNVETRINDSAKAFVDTYLVRVADGAATVAAIPLAPPVVPAAQVVSLGIYPTQFRYGTNAHVDWHFGDSNILQVGYWYDQLHANDAHGAFALQPDGAPVSTGASGLATGADGGPLYFQNQHDAIYTHRLWLEDSYQFLRDWTLTAGVAWQYTKNEGLNIPALFSPGNADNTYGYHNVLPTLKVTYQLSDSNQFYYDLTKNVRPPAVQSVFAATPQAAETTLNQEIGWRYNNSAVSVDTALFYDRFKNRQVSYSPDGASTDYFNAGNVVSKGVETSLHGKLPLDFNYSASWTYVNAVQLQNYSVGELVADTAGKQLYDTPKNIGTLGVGFDNQAVYANLFARFTDGFYGDLTNAEHLPSYTVVDFNAGYRFAIPSVGIKSASASLNVNNILNKHYLSGVSGGTVSATAGTAFYGAPTYFRGQPLNAFANVSINF